MNHLNQHECQTPKTKSTDVESSKENCQTKTKQNIFFIGRAIVGTWLNSAQFFISDHYWAG